MNTKPNVLQSATHDAAASASGESIGPTACRNYANAVREIIMENEPQRKDLLEFIDHVEGLYKSLDADGSSLPERRIDDRKQAKRHGMLVRIKMPGAFRRKAMLDYIEGKTSPCPGPEYAWRQPGDEPGRFYYIVVLVDPSLNGDGSHSDMPSVVWNAIMERLRGAYGENGEHVPYPFQDRPIAVELTNV